MKSSEILTKHIGITGYSIEVCYQEQSILNALDEASKFAKVEALNECLRSIKSFKESQERINSTEDNCSYRETKFDWINDMISETEIESIINRIKNEI
jgi:hypothetical protein